MGWVRPLEQGRCTDVSRCEVNTNDDDSSVSVVASAATSSASPPNIRVHDVCLQSSKHEERKLHQVDQFLLDKPEKKERTSKTKDKRDKTTDEEKEMRKERKLGRKRDRVEEAMLQEQKRRREEEKAMKMMSHSNGEMMEPSLHREKHHHTRDKSPYGRERERSHDRVELRDKHRRSSEGKRR